MRGCMPPPLRGVCGVPMGRGELMPGRTPGLIPGVAPRICMYGVEAPGGDTLPLALPLYRRADPGEVTLGVVGVGGCRYIYR